MEGILMTPSGQMHILLCYISSTKSDLHVSLWLSLWRQPAASYLSCDCVGLSLLWGLNSTVLLLSPSLFYYLITWYWPPCQLTALPVLKTDLFYWTCTRVCYIWITLFLLRHLFWPLSCFPLHSQRLHTLDHQCWTSGIPLWHGVAFIICKNDLIQRDHL